MFLVPYDRDRIVSNLEPAAFMARLASITATKPSSASLAGEPTFTGEVGPRTFRLMPVVRGRNTYLPRVDGTVEWRAGRTEIEITQTLHPLAIVVLVAMFGTLAVVCLVKGEPLSALVPLGFLAVFHVLMYVIGFRPEARKVKEQIAKLAA